MYEQIKFTKRAGEWRGAFSNELVLSVGYAALRENPGSTVDDLEHRADNDMYAEKERHYRESGKDRRSHNLNTATQ